MRKMLMFQIHKSFNELIESLLAMLDKDVADNCKTCKEYFSVLAHYVQEVRLLMLVCGLFVYAFMGERVLSSWVGLCCPNRCAVCLSIHL